MRRNRTRHKKEVATEKNPRMFFDGALIFLNESKPNEEKAFNVCVRFGGIKLVFDLCRVHLNSYGTHSRKTLPHFFHFETQL